MKWGLQLSDGLWVTILGEEDDGTPILQFFADKATTWGTKAEAEAVRVEKFAGAEFVVAKDAPAAPAKRAKPGKGKRSRLTDLRCAWRHASEEERAAFLGEVLE